MLAHRPTSQLVEPFWIVRRSDKHTDAGTQKIFPAKYAVSFFFSFLSTTLILAVFIAFRYIGLRIQHIPRMPLFAMASSVILIGMAGLYVYAYKFYKDSFYLFLAAGWLGNGFYIFLEGFYAAPDNLPFNLLVYVFAQISFVPFYLGSFINPDKTFSIKRSLWGVLIWFAWVFLSLSIALPIVYMQGSKFSPETKFLLATLGGIPFAVWTLKRTGKALAARLNSEIHGDWAKIFPWTFYLWAWIQPLYVVKLIPHTRSIVMTGFALGLMTKIVNSICSIVVIHSDFGLVRERAERLTILEDLGILTASIEHEIRNPLQIIANYLDDMREKYQGNKDIIEHLKNVEHQRRRIFATTEVIKNLRGGREYYGKLMTKTSVSELINRSVKAVKEELKPSHVLFKSDNTVLYTKAYQPVLQQVFVNIFKNSVEAIQEAGRKSGLITIELQESKDESNMLTVKITDNGCGIRESDIPKVGHLFSTKKEHKPNSGIGLFISRRILNFHSGSMSITSKEGAGTSVFIRLPLW